MAWIEHLALAGSIVAYIAMVARYEGMLPERPRNVIYLDDYR